jgi:hypothetical protein
MTSNILYPEDIEIGSTYFGSPVKAISDYNPSQTYLTIFKFVLEDGTTRELFADQELP